MFEEKRRERVTQRVKRKLERWDYESIRIKREVKEKRERETGIDKHTWDSKRVWQVHTILRQQMQLFMK